MIPHWKWKKKKKCNSQKFRVRLSDNQANSLIEVHTPTSVARDRAKFRIL